MDLKWDSERLCWLGAINTSTLSDIDVFVETDGELDPEHGIGVACRGSEVQAICHPDQYSNLAWDDIDALDAPYADADPKLG